MRPYERYRSFCEHRAGECLLAFKAIEAGPRRNQVIHLMVAWLELAKESGTLLMQGVRH